MADHAARAAVEVSPEPGVRIDDPAAEISSLSLQQALIDFEIANGRVVDLTQRLIEASDELTEARTELVRLRAERVELEREIEAYRHSRALKVATGVRAMVRAIRR